MGHLYSKDHGPPRQESEPVHSCLAPHLGTGPLSIGHQHCLERISCESSCKSAWRPMENINCFVLCPVFCCYFCLCDFVSETGPFGGTFWSHVGSFADKSEVEINHRGFWCLAQGRCMYSKIMLGNSKFSLHGLLHSLSLSPSVGFVLIIYIWCWFWFFFIKLVRPYIFLPCHSSSPTQSSLLTYHPQGADSCTLTSLSGTPANRFGETRGTRWLQQRYTSVGKVKCAQQVVGAQTTNVCWKVEDCS